MQARRIFRTLLVVAIGVFVACSSDEISTLPGSTGTESVLKRGNGGDPGSLDPVLAEDVHAFNVLLDLCEGLLTLAADGTIAPGVAASWEVSPDGLEYRFSLRADAAWSDGKPVTAQHFVAGFRHAVQSGSRAPNVFLLAPLANYQPVLRGELPVETLGIRAEDDHALVIELERPAGYFPGILTMPIACPRLPDVHDDPTSFRIPSRFVGNGPYVLDDWQPGGVLQLRRSRTFRAADAAIIEFVQYYPIADPTAELNLYRAGQLDITATISPAAFTTLRRDRPHEIHLASGLALYYLAFDLSEPPLDNLALRKALSMAIDRARLVEILGRGEQAAYGLVPPGVHAHVPASYAWRDTPGAQREALAQEAYAAAGYHARSPLTIKLTYDAGDIHEKVALAVRSMWQEVLGIDVSLRRLEWKAFLDSRDDRSAWQIMRFAWVGDFDDASTFTDVFATGSAQNLPGYSNRRYDELLKQASAIGATEQRQRLLTEAERILMEEYPIVPLYFLVSKHLVSPRVRGYQPNVLDRHPSRHLRLQER